MQRVRDGQVVTGISGVFAAASAAGALLCAALVLVAAPVGAQEWGQFRGPNAAGVVADNPGLPERWSATENVAWRTPLPGLGWSSPIVASGLVFLTTVVSDGEIDRDAPNPPQPAAVALDNTRGRIPDFPEQCVGKDGL